MEKTGRKRRNPIADNVCIKEGHHIVNLPVLSAYDRECRQLIATASETFCLKCGMAIEDIKRYTKPYDLMKTVFEMRRKRLVEIIQREIAIDKGESVEPLSFPEEQK